MSVELHFRNNRRQTIFGKDAGRHSGRMWRAEMGIRLHGFPFPAQDVSDSIGDPAQK